MDYFYLCMCVSALSLAHTMCITIYMCTDHHMYMCYHLHVHVLVQHAWMWLSAAHLLRMQYQHFHFLAVAVHTDPESCGQDSVGQVVHALWRRRETEADRRSPLHCNCQRCQTHQLRCSEYHNIIFKFSSVGERIGLCWLVFHTQWRMNQFQVPILPRLELLNSMHCTLRRSFVQLYFYSIPLTLAWTSLDIFAGVQLSEIM